MINEQIAELKDFIRQPYAWPGGYPKMLILGDCETVCPSCAKENYRLISEATRLGGLKEWAVFGVGVHWEGEAIECAHCGALTESAYGVPEEESNDV